MFELNSELVAKVINLTDNQVIEIDNFYKDPDKVREYAISSKKITRSDNEDLLAGAIGRRVCEDTLELGYQLKNTFESLCQHPGWGIEFNKKDHDYYWSGMRFMVNVTNNREIIEDGRDMIAHRDPNFLKWACVVYLNTADECEGGTGFYRCESESDEIILEHMSKMRYNKAVLYLAGMPHGAIMENNMFKYCDRLVQVMFM